MSYLQSKQGEPIPDSMGTNRSSLYAVLNENEIKWVSLLSSYVHAVKT